VLTNHVAQPPSLVAKLRHSQVPGPKTSSVEASKASKPYKNGERVRNASKSFCLYEAPEDPQLTCRLNLAGASSSALLSSSLRAWPPGSSHLKAKHRRTSPTLPLAQLQPAVSPTATDQHF
jgi:hypothetical protein